MNRTQLIRNVPTAACLAAAAGLAIMTPNTLASQSSGFSAGASQSQSESHSSSTRSHENHGDDHAEHPDNDSEHEDAEHSDNDSEHEDAEHSDNDSEHEDAEHSDNDSEHEDAEHSDNDDDHENAEHEDNDDNDHEGDDDNDDEHAENESIETLVLTGVVRDFRELSDPHGHPDFERRPSAGFGQYVGNLADQLDDNGKPVFTGNGRKLSSQWRDSYGRNINPALYSSDLGDNAGSWGVFNPGGIDSVASFRQWYRDVPGVNMSAPLQITLHRQPGTDVFTFDDKQDPNYQAIGGFFPINGQLFGNSAGENKNFHFTFELATEFVCERNSGQVFTFTGDDDVWVFIDGRNVIDIGGVHGATSQTIDLDRLDWLQDGQTYSLKFFFAERHRTQSNFRIDTTLKLRNGRRPRVMAMYD